MTSKSGCLIVWKQTEDATMQHSRKITADQKVSFTNERSDRYAHVLCRLGPRWRLIVCSNWYQWIAQYNKCVKSKPSWVSERFFRTRPGIEAFFMTRGKKYIFYEDATYRVSFLPMHFGDFLQIEKAAAQKNSHTTADLSNWQHNGYVPYTQQNDGGIARGYN